MIITILGVYYHKHYLYIKNAMSVCMSVWSLLYGCMTTDMPGLVSAGILAMWSEPQTCVSVAVTRYILMQLAANDHND